jgi:hypothetical protein
MRTVRVHEAAAQEAIEAAAWYERERPGLGAEFDQAVRAALDLLETEILPVSRRLPSSPFRLVCSCPPVAVGFSE